MRERKDVAGQWGQVLVISFDSTRVHPYLKSLREAPGLHKGRYVTSFGDVVVWSDEQGRVGGKLYLEARDLACDAIRSGCDPQNAAEVLMQAARTVLADNVEFQHVVGNVLTHFGIEGLS